MQDILFLVVQNYFNHVYPVSRRPPLYRLSDELQTVVNGVEHDDDETPITTLLSRLLIIRLWQYIRARNLQNPNSREIMCAMTICGASWTYTKTVSKLGVNPYIGSLLEDDGQRKVGTTTTNKAAKPKRESHK